MSHKAFFLDRDGTLNVDYNYVHTKEEWTWCDGAIDALRNIQSHGFKLVVVTNQSGIVKGKYSEQQVHDLHRWVDQQLKKQGVSIDLWNIAPWHPEFQSIKDTLKKTESPAWACSESPIRFWISILAPHLWPVIRFLISNPLLSWA